MIMSTHVYNSQIDPDSLVTFSKKWVNQLRHLGFQGLLMSDALFMVKKYPATLGSIFKNLSEYQACGVDHFAAITASESLLSGHQIVMLESELKDTRRVLDQLKKLESCSTSLGLRFKKRVEDNQKDLQFFDQKYEMNFRKQRSVARLWKNEIKDALILLKLYEGKMRTREVCDLKKKRHPIT
jgi:beta-glucosidase-like glycosyl hydrolase